MADGESVDIKYDEEFIIFLDKNGLKSRNPSKADAHMVMYYSLWKEIQKIKKQTT